MTRSAVLEPAAVGEAEPRLSQLDQALFAELQRDGRIPFTTLAQRLGVSEAQIRRRVKSLTEADVFAIAPIANPRLLGFEQLACIGLNVRGRHMQTACQQLLAFPEVSFVLATSGQFNLLVEVGCGSSSELYQLLLKLRKVAGVQNSETFVYLDILQQKYQWVLDRDPAATETEEAGVFEQFVEVDDVDAGIIRELEPDGRASFRDIARRLGLSERTVSNRFTRLVEQHVLQVIAVGNPLNLGFQAVAWLGIKLSRGADLEAAGRALGRVQGIDYVIVATGPYDLLCELVCRDSEELLAVLEDDLGAMEDVSHADTFMCLRILYRSTAAWSAGRSLVPAQIRTAVDGRTRLPGSVAAAAGSRGSARR